MSDPIFEMPVIGIAVAASATGLHVLANWAGLLL